jgi:hypothetical protein
MNEPYELKNQRAVAQEVWFMPISGCPTGVKVQLLGAGGIPQYGYYNGKDNFWTHWAPLPRVPKPSAFYAKSTALQD